MSLYLGIDFGTSTNYITRWDEKLEKAVPVENMTEHGEKNIFKNIIYYESPTNVVIGKKALDKGTVEPFNFVHGIKRKLEDDEWKQPIKSINKSLNSKEIATDIFREIKAKIETNSGGKSIDGVVISVPFAFQNKERQKIKCAAEDAGLKVLGLIEEPVAAAVSFGLFDTVQEGKNEKVLIFDLGGGTFDVTIFEFRKNGLNDISIEVLNTDGHKNLGGKDIDKIIVDKFEQRLNYKLETIPDERQFKRDILKLTEQAEITKENLSEYEEDDIFVSNLYDNNILEFEEPLTAEEFNEWIKRNGFLSKIREVLEKSLYDIDLEPEDISRIILVGGTSNIPIIKEEVEKFFGKKPEAIKNPGELVGEGAGIYCGCLINNSLKYKITTRMSYAVGLNVGNKFKALIEKNSKYEEFSDIKEYTIKNNTKCNIKIYQGNSSDLDKCCYIGNISINANELSDGKIGIQLGTDKSGIVKYRLYDGLRNKIKEGELK